MSTPNLTPTPAPEIPLSLRWIIKPIAAATNDGRIIRFRKTHKRTGLPPFYVITPKHDHHQINIGGKQQTVQYWIAQAWHGPEPKPGCHVEFKDGNRANFLPHNLAWALSARASARLVAEYHRNTLTRKPDHYRALDGYPRLYATPEGKIIRAYDIKPAKPLAPTLVYSKMYGHLVVYVQLPPVKGDPTTRARIPLQEIIADLHLTPRPSPHHRAFLIDSTDPTNTRPDNLTWRIPSGSRRPWPHTFRPEVNPDTRAPVEYSRPFSPSERTYHDPEYQRIQDQTAQHIRNLRDTGARRLLDDYRLWVTPAGECLTLDPETARIHYHDADPATGKVRPLPNVSIHLPTAIADAYHSTPYAPNLDYQCPLTHTVTTHTGNLSDCTPANLKYTPRPGGALRTPYKTMP